MRRAYLAMSDQKLPEIQEVVIAKTKVAMTEKVMGVEDELGAVVAELGSGTEVPGGPYINLWSGIGVALENNQTIVDLMARIAQQVKDTTSSLNQATQSVNQASVEVSGVRAQVMVVSKKQSDEEFKVGKNGGRISELTHLLAHVQQELKQKKYLTGRGTLPSLTPPALGAFASEWHPRGRCGDAVAIGTVSCPIAFAL
jgi:hypothetical protein